MNEPGSNEYTEILGQNTDRRTRVMTGELRAVGVPLPRQTEFQLVPMDDIRMTMTRDTLVKKLGVDELVERGVTDDLLNEPKYIGKFIELVRNFQADVKNGTKLDDALAFIAERAAIEYDLEEEVKRLTTEQYMDPLGIRNKKYVTEIYPRFIERLKKMGVPFAFLMIDLDDFSINNNVGGHDYGDGQLRLSVEAITEAVREGDLPARYGGDEETVLLMDVTPEEAVTVAERIRANINAKLRYPIATNTPGEAPGTASIGVAVYDGTPGTEDMDLAELMRRADMAAYKSKLGDLAGGPAERVRGKNRVTLYNPALEKEDLKYEKKK